jgi:hypothetical protein
MNFWQSSTFKSIFGGGTMPIADLTDKQLDNMEANYRRANKTEGGIYACSSSLAPLASFRSLAG